MKKVNLLLFSVCVVAAGLFSGCNKDETNDTAISFAGDTGYTAADATVTAGSTFKVKWTVTSSTNMGYFSILKDGSAYDVWSQKEIPSASKSTYIDEVTITAPLTSGTYTYDFVVYDKDKVELGRKSIVITVTASTSKVNTLSVTLGSATWNTTDGSFYSIGTQLVYKYNASGVAANADFGYLYGDASGGNLATLFSPEWSSAQSLTQKITTPANATKFALTSVTIAEFDAITTDDALLISSTSGASLQYVNNLQVGGTNAGKIIAFVTQSGKKGLIKLVSITNGSNSNYPQGSGTAAFSIKVQK